MAKDVQDEEGVKEAGIPEQDEREPSSSEQTRHSEAEEATPKDVRGAIRAAFKEHAEQDSEEREPKQRAPRKTKEDQDSASDNLDRDVQETNKRQRRPRDVKVSEEEPKEEKTTPREIEQALEPPPYYRNKAKATWERLSPEDRQAIVAREQEVSNGFGQISQRLQQAADLERVIAPHSRAIQQFGVTPAQTVERLFQWMEALSGPNKVGSFKELAKSFGVDISQLTGSSSPVQNQTTPAETNEPPNWFSEYTHAVNNEIGGLKQTLQNQQRAAAENFVVNWAKDKPFYQRVAPVMGQLIDSGLVPLKEGIIDLDQAYEKACKLDPEVMAYIQNEQATKAAEEAKAKAAKEAKERADKLVRARRAGTGIKPGAPAANVPIGNPKLNGTNRKESVRDSIRAAMDELRE